MNRAGGRPGFVDDNGSSSVAKPDAASQRTPLPIESRDDDGPWHTGRPMYGRAIVSEVPTSFADALRADPVPIDVAKARDQHAAYVAALRELGLEVTVLPAAEDHPDGCFVEDTAIHADGTSLICRPGAPSRRGEVIPMTGLLGALGPTRTTEAPATLDGGDCLRMGRHWFVGHSRRTNPEGIEAVRAAYPDFEVVAIPVTDALHLKSVCSGVGDLVLLLEGTLPPESFAPFEVQPVPRSEAPAANALWLGDERVIVQPGHPETRDALQRRGFTVREVDTSELAKADSALTCLSILLPAR